MRMDIIERVEKVADYIIDHKCTIREAAKVFGMSKTTVHIDVSERLAKINRHKYKKVQEILKINYEEKSTRGGRATCKKKIAAYIYDCIYNHNIIKLRVWDNDTKKMYYMKELKITVTNDIISIFIISEKRYSTNNVIMKFTGYTDMNNTDIYEKDILIGTEHRSCVTYHGMQCKSNDWTNKIKHVVERISGSELHLLSCYSRICEVKGNIIENPELDK